MCLISFYKNKKYKALKFNQENVLAVEFAHKKENIKFSGLEILNSISLQSFSISYYYDVLDQRK